ncbi:MAG: LytR C-terminal domain-containing protein [Egibacteraceae bacterium]
MSGDFGTYDEPRDSLGHRIGRVIFGGFLVTALVVGLYLSLSGGRSGAPAGEEVTETEQQAADGGNNQDGGGGNGGAIDPAEDADADAQQQLIDSAPAPENTTIQLLDGSSSDATDDASDVLTELGYDVIAINAGKDYDETTVFFNDGNRRAAGALRARDGRFGEIAPNDRGLSTAVDLHVIVGADWED